MNKIMFALSLAKKSGKLIYGFDPVKQAVADKTAKMVFVTSDTSEKTVKRVQQFCQGITDVNVTSLTQFEVSQITNKLTGVFAVVDENIAVLCRNAISIEKGE
ncbi:MAG: ribosomal L7Ae/L30e/S12e/Gadd45 family protein [Oscillospiraceae bacterium]|nr:ribosomal L7Ae/L30e/S12e/Gadd45 family protein [Oscillospiraceae bacterium]